MKLKDLIVLSVIARILVVIGCVGLIVVRYSVGFKINDGLPSLIKAASESNYDKVKHLLEAGYFVDQSDVDFNVSLHYATILYDDLNSEKIFALLLKNYASTRQQNENGIVPLHGVAEIDNLSRRMYVIKALLLHGANISDRDKKGFGILERTLELIDNTGLKTTLDWWGWLFSEEDIKLATQKSEYFAHGNTPDTMRDFNVQKSLKMRKHGLNDLFMAILKGDAGQISKHSTLVNKKEGSFGLTPLHAAVAQSEYAFELMQALLKDDADVNATNNNNATPLHMVMHNVGFVLQKQLISYLIENGADINAKDGNGDTILHLAVKKNNVALVKFLIEGFFKIDVRIKNNQNKRPKDLARELDYGQIYKLLRLL